MVKELISKSEFARRAKCDEKQVRRAVFSGRLVENSQGKLDAQQLDTVWLREQSPAAARRLLAKEAKAVSGADESATMSEVTTDPSETIDMRAALAHKEHFTGRLRELEFLAKSKDTVLMDVARKVLFDEARAARDAWLNFVPKNAALIAADLGLEAGRVSDILTGYVHRQLAALGNQDGAFSQD